MFRSLAKCIVLALALMATQEVGQAFGQSFGEQVVGKKCGNCGGSVPLSSQVGDTCPHCGGVWGAQQHQYLGKFPGIVPNTQPSFPFVPQGQSVNIGFAEPAGSQEETPQADRETSQFAPQPLRVPESPTLQPAGVAARDAWEQIPKYENWIRFNCNFSRREDIEQAKKNFRAVVNMAMASPRSSMYVRFADLADIDGATFFEDTGELMIFGPKLTDDNFMPPLLWDDFVVALDILSSGGDPMLSIGTPGGRLPSQEEMEQFQRTGVIPVLYEPESLEQTHAGTVLFEADRWLKTLGIGRDNFTGKLAWIPTVLVMPNTNGRRGPVNIGSLRHSGIEVGSLGMAV